MIGWASHCQTDARLSSGFVVLALRVCRSAKRLKNRLWPWRYAWAPWSGDAACWGDRCSIAVPGTAPSVWRHADAGAEDASQMCLVGETAEDGDLAERLLRHRHQFASSVDAALKQVGVWWLAKADPERSRELAPPKTDQIGEIGNTQRVVEMHFDVAGHPPSLPRRQSRPAPAWG